MPDRRRHGEDEDRVRCTTGSSAHGLSLRDRLIAHLPRWAPWAARLPWLANLRDALPGAARLGEAWLGLLGAAHAAALAARHVPARARAARDAVDGATPTSCSSSTPSRNYFEPENAHAALARAARRRLSRARSRARRAAMPNRRGRCAAAAPISPPAWSTRRSAKRGAWSPRSRRTSRAASPIVGLEPSCLLSLRDEFLVMGLGEAAQRLSRARVPDRGVPGARASRRTAAAAARGAAADARAAARPLPPEGVRRDGAGASTCCGSCPASRSTSSSRAAAAWPAASATRPRTTTCRCGWPSCRCCRRCARPTPDTLIVADGTSCRHQIADGTRGAGSARRCMSSACWSARSRSRSPRPPDRAEIPLAMPRGGSAAVKPRANADPAR